MAEKQFSIVTTRSGAPVTAYRISNTAGMSVTVLD